METKTSKTEQSDGNEDLTHKTSVMAGKACIGREKEWNQGPCGYEPVALSTVVVKI